MSASLSDTAFNFRLAQFVRQVSLQRSPSDLAGVLRLHAFELLGSLDTELICFDAEHAVLWRLDGSEDIAVNAGVLGAVARSGQGRRAKAKGVSNCLEIKLVLAGCEHSWAPISDHA
jgi:hypothetical protein